MQFPLLESAVFCHFLHYTYRSMSFVNSEYTWCTKLMVLYHFIQRGHNFIHWGRNGFEV